MTSHAAISTSKKLVLGVLATVAISLLASPSMAATMYWEPAGSGVANGGAGTWDATGALWAVDAAGSSYAAWDNLADYSAYFGIAGGVVTVADNVTVGKLTFQAGLNYTLEGPGIITLAGTDAGVISLYSPNSAGGPWPIINASLAGTSGITFDTTTGTHSTRGLTLAGDNSNLYGQIQVKARNLVITSSTALGVQDNTRENGTIVSVYNDLVLFGGYLTLDGTAGALNINEYIEISKTGYLISKGADNISNGTLRMGSEHSANFRVDDHSLTVNGDIQTAGVLYKKGAGTLILAADAGRPATNLNNANLIVEAGKLVVNRTVNNVFYSQANLVAAGATLAGSGTVYSGSSHAAGNWIINGTLAPGDVGAAGKLTFDNARLTLAPTSSLTFDLSSDDSSPLNDLIQVGPVRNGNLTLDGSLVVNALTGTLEDGGIYKLFQYKGTVTDNGLDIDIGNSISGYDFAVQIDTVNKAVNLLVTFIPPLTKMGDADGDTFVDDDDLSLLLSNWKGGDVGWAKGDFNDSHDVDDDDLSLLLSNWTGSGGGTIPEPATIGLLILGSLGLISRKRRA